MITAIIIGALLLLALLLGLISWWLIDLKREREPLFAVPDGRPAAGWALPPPVLAPEPPPAAGPVPPPRCGLPRMPLPAPKEHSPARPRRAQPPTPFSKTVQPSPVLARAAAMLPPGFDPKVDSLVDGIPAVRDE